MWSYAQSNITFSVDMTGQTYTDVYVSGSFNGWSGTDNPLTNVGGEVFEATIPIADGEFEYKFTFDDWTGQEEFTQGDVCTITNYGYTNRRLVVAGADQMLETVAFNSCYETGVNPGGPHSITLKVDMTEYPGSFTTVYVNGENYNDQGFGNWCGDCVPMNDIGANIWAITLSLEEYAYQFKFTVDGWTDQESFNPGDPYTSTDGTYTNRYVQVDGPKTLECVWNASTYVLGTGELANNIDFNIYPNPSQDVWHVNSSEIIDSIEIFDILGKRVAFINADNEAVTIDASSFDAGTYFATINTQLGSQTTKLIKK